MHTYHYTNKSDALKLLEKIKPTERICFVDMPNDVYHSILGINSSKLKNAAYSANKYHNPRSGQYSKALQFGTIVHNVLEQCINNETDIRDIVKTDSELKYAAPTTNLGKVQRAIQGGSCPNDVIHPFTTIKENRIARASGLIVLKEDQLTEATRAVADQCYTLVDDKDFEVLTGFLTIARDHDVLMQFLKREVKREHSVFYRNEQGLLLKARPDVWVDDEIVDWKSSRGIVTHPKYYGVTQGERIDNATRCVKRIIETYGYEFSAAHYLNVCDAKEFTLVLLDKDNIDIFVVSLGELYLCEAYQRVDSALQVVTSNETDTLYLENNTVLFLETEELL